MLLEVTDLHGDGLQYWTEYCVATGKGVVGDAGPLPADATGIAAEVSGVPGRADRDGLRYRHRHDA